MDYSRSLRDPVMTDEEIEELYLRALAKSGEPEPYFQFCEPPPKGTVVKGLFSGGILAGLVWGMLWLLRTRP